MEVRFGAEPWAFTMATPWFTWASSRSLTRTPSSSTWPVVARASRPVASTSWALMLPTSVVA